MITMEACLCSSSYGTTMAGLGGDAAGLAGGAGFAPPSAGRGAGTVGWAARVDDVTAPWAIARVEEKDGAAASVDEGGTVPVMVDEGAIDGAADGGEMAGAGWAGAV